MTIARTIDRDPMLPHQIIIGTGRHPAEIAVSCNCRKLTINGAYGPMGHVPVGEGSVLEAQALYNNPANHYPVAGEPDFHPDFNNYKKTRHVEVTE